MDCWSSSFTVDDEFEKLVLRMNPPRYFILFSLMLVIWGVHFPNRGSFVFLKFIFVSLVEMVALERFWLYGFMILISC